MDLLQEDLNFAFWSGNEFQPPEIDFSGSGQPAK
jgi:hypothetical protein